MKKEIAIQAVKDALSNLNIQEEGGDNKGKWIKIYLDSVGLEEGNAWCAAWLKYRYVAASKTFGEKLSAGFLRLTGYTPDWHKYAVKNKIWIPAELGRINPKNILPGYAIFYYSREKGRIYHCGMVIRTSKDGIITIEGNTSPGHEIEANGDGVFMKRRLWSKLEPGSGFMKIY